MLIKKRHVGFYQQQLKKIKNKHVCRVHKRNKWIKKDKREWERVVSKINTA